MNHILTGASYGTSTATIFAGLTVDEWGIAGVVVGIFFIILTYATTVWFKFRAEKNNRKAR